MEIGTDLKKVKCIIVDIEGVIRDSKNLFHHGYEYALSTVNLKLLATPSETWKLRSFAEFNSQKEILKALYALSKKKIPAHVALWKKDPVGFVKDAISDVKINERVLEKIEEAYNLYITNQKNSFRAAPIRAGKKAVKLLRKDGIKVCALTNSTREQIFPWLTKRKITFDDLLCKNDLKNPKPSADGITKICAKQNLSQNEVIYIGDTEIDAITASNAKVTFIGVNENEQEKKRLMKLGAVNAYDNLMHFYLDFKNL